MAFRDLRNRQDKREEVASNASSSPKTTTTYIDGGCEFAGQLRFQESVTIDGHVEGEIDCGKLVVVGPSATIRARIHAESVVIHGTVEGDVDARRKITLHKSAQVSGELRTAGIAIEEGACFKGRIAIGADEKDKDSAAPRKKNSTAATAPKPAEAVAASAPATP